MRYYELYESTTTDIVGRDSAGLDLAVYLHRQIKLNNNADWVETTAEEMIERSRDWRFANEWYNLILVEATDGWAMIVSTFSKWKYYLSLRDTTPRRSRRETFRKRVSKSLDHILDVEIPQELGTIKNMWLSERKPEGAGNRDYKRDMQKWAVDQQAKHGITDPDELNSISTINAKDIETYRKLQDISKNSTGILSGKAGKRNPSTTSVSIGKTNLRRPQDSLASEIGDYTYKLYPIALERAWVRADRKGLDSKVEFILGKIKRYKEEAASATPMKLITQWVSLIQELNNYEKSPETEDIAAEIRQNPTSVKSKKYLLDIAINNLLGTR